VFDTKRLPYKDKIADKAWGDIPTCKESGLDVDYLMLRGIFMPPDVKPEHVAFYVELMQKVRASAEWKKFMEEGAFNQTFMSGVEFTRWIANEEIRHRLLMQEAGFVAK
jgi:tripartite-type tricarboxylate transporter receptor subunit TctC